jgi:hypothetical protein
MPADLVVCGVDFAWRILKDGRECPEFPCTFEAAAKCHAGSATHGLLRCGVRVHESEEMHDDIIVWPDRAAAWPWLPGIRKHTQASPCYVACSCDCT